MLTLLRRSLLLQSTAIVVASLFGILILMQVLLHSTIIFRVFPALLERQAETVLTLAELLDGVEEPLRTQVISAFSTNVRTAWIEQSFPPGATRAEFYEKSFLAAASKSGKHLAPELLRFRFLGPADSEFGREQGALAPSNLFGLSMFEVSVRLATGEVLVVHIAAAGILGRYMLVLFLLALIISLGISSAGLRLAFRPLRALESAADSIGQSSRLEPLVERGPEDVRRVVRALNAMQERVRSLLADRSRMIAAIAHDVRTSLTHMQLRLDAAEDRTDQALLGDIKTMSRLVNDMVLYARAEQPSSDEEIIELGQFVRESIEALPDPVPCRVQGAPFDVVADRVALQRALVNLIENSRRYASQTEVSVISTDTGCTIRVEDRGPGIAEALLPRISDPFFRGEGSRSRETGGSGLGLSIARALLSAQGATLTLANREGGGLHASIHFSARTRID